MHPLQITSSAEPVIPLLGRVGAVALSSEPPDGSFELKNSQGLNIWAADFPKTSAWLPAGDYRLAARRGGYQKEVRLVVSPNETNRTVVKFIYGAAEILSEPSEAKVSVNNADQGQTPLTLTNMIPGKYQIRLVKDNYEPEVFELNVSEAGVSKVSRKLKNVRYAWSMEAARSAIRVNNNILAFANLEAALVEQPNDPDATELMVKVQPAALRYNALALAEAGRFTEIAAVIEELEKLNPKAETTEALRAQITQIEARKKQESADHLARQEKQRVEAEIQKRKEELEATFEFLHRDLVNANTLPTATWISTKSSEQVRAAIDTMSKTLKEGRVSGLNRINDHLFTLRFGGGIPVFGAVYQTRLAVCDLESGHTEIRARTSSVSLVDIVTPEIESIRSKNQLEKFRKSLSIQLGGDLR